MDITAIKVSRGSIGCWRVEAIDIEGDGECYLADFHGPLAYERAMAYAAWLEEQYQGERGDPYLAGIMKREG